MLSGLMSDRRGNFAIIFAMLLLPIVAAVALAVDHTSASARHSEMHNATDAAVLALARAGNDLSDQQAREIAEDFLRANYAGSFKELTVRRDGQTWTVAMTADSGVRFANVLGFGATPIGVVSSATYAQKTYEIGLVLDTTGSMAGEKLRQLKEAATALVDTMAVATADRPVKFALVPFSSFVNVGPQYGPQFDKQGRIVRAGAEWLDLRGESPVPQSELLPGLSRFEMFHHLGSAWEGCIETRDPAEGKAYDVTDIPADPDEPESLFVPAFSIDEPDDKQRGTPLYPNSYLNDRGTSLRAAKAERLDKKYNVEMHGRRGGENDDDEDDEDDEGLLGGLVGGVLGTLSDATFGPPPAVDSSKTTHRYNRNHNKGPNFDCLASPIVPLTDDYEQVKHAIEALTAEGNTNLMEGIMWGWRVLSPGQPFTEGRPKSEADNEKIVIFLTDGANTWAEMPNDFGSSYSSVGYLADERLVPAVSVGSSMVRAMDEKTLAGCRNARADGITIYTIRLELRDSDTGALLEECAGAAERYFDVPDVSDLTATFEYIAQSIKKVRLSS